LNNPYYDLLEESMTFVYRIKDFCLKYRLYTNTLKKNKADDLLCLVVMF